jgi:hypothetical protein
MRTRIIVCVTLLIALLGVGTYAGRAGELGHRQWSAINFIDPVQVKDQIIMGPVLIVHDDEKMARGEACTTFYRFDPAKGPQEKLVSFHCRPVQRSVVDHTTFSTVSTAAGCKRLTEYQIAGDSEGHGVPSK